MVPISQGRHTEVSERDAWLVSRFKWSASDCSRGRGTKVYAVRLHRCPVTRKRFKVYLHRWLLNHPQGLVVDHINGDSLDNRRENLRAVTFEENARATQFRKRVEPWL